jgi:hypothetical protein
MIAKDVGGNIIKKKKKKNEGYKQGNGCSCESSIMMAYEKKLTWSVKSTELV